MTRFALGLKNFGAFWWDFVVGDDWRIALGVVLAIGFTCGLAAIDVAAWWLLPLTVAALLVYSLARASRPSPPDS